MDSSAILPPRTVMHYLFAACLSLALLFAPKVGDSDPVANAALVPLGNSAHVAAFGTVVSAAGEDVFVGEPSGFRFPGTVHVYRKSPTGTWESIATLRKPDGLVGDRFGSVLSSAGGVLAVGDPQGHDGNGAVHIYRKSPTGDWMHSETLVGEVDPNAESTSRRFGAALAISGGTLLVGAPASGNTRGVVYIYQDSGNTLKSSGTLSRIAAQEDGEFKSENSGDGFGSAIGLHGSLAIVGAPNANNRSGAVVLYKQSAGQWNEIHHIDRSAEDDASIRFGSVVSTNGSWAFIGSPLAGESVGMVLALKVSDADQVTPFPLVRPDLSARASFGSAIAATNGEVYISAQRDRGGAGSVFRYDLTEGPSLQPTSISWGEDDTRVRLGSSVAVTDNVLVVGAVGDAYGEGSVFFLDRGDQEFADPVKYFADVQPFPRFDGEQVDCSEGDAAGFDCTDIDLVSFVPNVEMGINRGVRLNDVWGWTDPMSGKEYALIGHMEGTEFVDMSNPNDPIHLGTLERTEGARANTWRDIKVYKDHAFIVADGAGDHGIQIFDLTQLRTVSNPPVEFNATALYDEVHSAHNIVINEDTGFAYTVGGSSGGETCGGGLYMLDIREPINPKFVGCFADETTGRASTGGSHDSQCVTYNGPDTEYRGREVCFSANETAISIADVTDKENPKAISTGSYPDFAYIHQGWLSEDHAYFFQNDEGDETSGKVDKTRTLVWDVRDLDDPIMVRQYFAVDGSTDHNLYVKGTLLYSTNNSAGLRIVDISDPVNPVEVGHFDTTPHGTNAAGFDGTWSSYPYFESGVIVVTSRREGVFFLKKKEQEF